MIGSLSLHQATVQEGAHGARQAGNAFGSRGPAPPRPRAVARRRRCRAVPEVVGDDGIDVGQVQRRVLQHDLLGTAAGVEGVDDRLQPDSRAPTRATPSASVRMGGGGAMRSRASSSVRPVLDSTILAGHAGFGAVGIGAARMSIVPSVQNDYPEAWAEYLRRSRLTMMSHGPVLADRNGWRRVPLGPDFPTRCRGSLCSSCCGRSSRWSHVTCRSGRAPAAASPSTTTRDFAILSHAVASTADCQSRSRGPDCGRPGRETEYFAGSTGNANGHVCQGPAEECGRGRA